MICQSTYPEHRVMFRVRECSGYVEKQRQTLCEMKKDRVDTSMNKAIREK